MIWLGFEEIDGAVDELLAVGFEVNRAVFSCPGGTDCIEGDMFAVACFCFACPVRFCVPVIVVAIGVLVLVCHGASPF